VAVLLNELAYLKYESSKTSETDEAISQKQRNLAILFSLIESVRIREVKKRVNYLLVLREAQRAYIEYIGHERPQTLD